jgi:hypothetical protein
MANYGNRVIMPYGGYPNTSFSQSPAKNLSYISKLNEEIEDLSFDLQTKTKKRQDLRIMGSLVSLVDSIAARRTKEEERAAFSQPSSESVQMFASFQKQQDLMLQLMQNMTKKTEKKYKQPKIYKEQALEKEYQNIKSDPEQVKKMLAELNFDDDGAEDYADKEKKLKFNSNLSDEEKLKIINKIEKTKKQRLVEKVDKTKGISRFRMLGFVVIFPIFVVSSLIERRLKISKDSLESLKQAIDIFIDVAKS